MVSYTPAAEIVNGNQNNKLKSLLTLTHSPLATANDPLALHSNSTSPTLLTFQSLTAPFQFRQSHTLTRGVRGSVSRASHTRSGAPDGGRRCPVFAEELAGEGVLLF